MIVPRSDSCQPVIQILPRAPPSGRPIISMLTLATIFSRGHVGLSVNCLDPRRPDSSPQNVMKIRDRAGLSFIAANASARVNTAVTPDASSSAPL